MQKSVASMEYRILVGLLRTARKSVGVTQVELGKRLDEVQSFVSSIEHGQRRIDMVEAWRWCQVLNVSFATLASTFEEKARNLHFLSSAGGGALGSHPDRAPGAAELELPP